MRTKEDLFASDDEPELWNCKECKNHNINVKKQCCKCGKNKYNKNKEEKEEIKEKLKEWHWKCYFCNYTNKYLKFDQCYGCKKYTQ